MSDFFVNILWVCLLFLEFAHFTGDFRDKTFLNKIYFWVALHLGVILGFSFRFIADYYLCQFFVLRIVDADA